MSNPTPTQLEIEAEIVDAMKNTVQCVNALFALLIDLERRGNPLVEPEMWRRALGAQLELEGAFLALRDRAAQQHRKQLQ